MARKAQTGSTRAATPVVKVFPPLYIEGLAYHESGHAVMAVLLDMPIKQIVIGPKCDDPDYNARVELGTDQIQKYKSGLMLAASEPSEKLSPNFAQFAGLHKIHRHLAPFNRGLRTDRVRAFNAVAESYYLLGITQKTALTYFKRDYRDLATQIIQIPSNEKAVHRLAEALIRDLILNGMEAEAIILKDGPLMDMGLLERWRE